MRTQPKAVWQRLAAISFAAVSPAAWSQAASPAGVGGKDAINDVFSVDATSLGSAIQSGMTSGSILAQIAGIVCTAALFAAAAIIVLTFINGVLQTGEKGQVLGRYSPVWVPIRAVIGLGMLTPLGSGYSVIQILVLWVAMWGSQLADDGWSKANGYMSSNMTLSRVVPNQKTRDTVQSIYRMELCARAIRRSASRAQDSFGVTTPQLPAAGSRYEVDDPWFGGQQFVHEISYDGYGDLNGEEGLCGKIALRREASDDPAVAQTMDWQVQNLHGLRTALAGVAIDEISGRRTGGEIRGQLAQIERDYAEAERRRARAFLARTGSTEQAVRQAQTQRAAAAGWMSAGSYYLTFAGFAATVNEQMTEQPEFSAPRTNDLPASVRQDVSPWMATASNVTGGAADPASSENAPGTSWWDKATNFSPIDQFYKQIMAELGITLRGVFEQVKGALLEDGNPILAFVALGQAMISALEIAFAAALVVIGVASALTGGFGGILLFMTIAPAFMPLLLCAIFLAYFLPGIPYFIWMMGVAGWLLMLVQCVSAAPLWAAAHVVPEGEGFAGDRAKTGYMLIIGLVARPLLMVVGLVAGMLIVEFMARLIGVTFTWWIDAVMIGHSMGIIGTVSLCVLLASLVLVMVRWSFSLIYVVPDTVLRFIGSASESFGEARVADQVKEMLLAGYGAARSGASGTFGAVGAKLQRLGKNPEKRTPKASVLKG